VIADEMERLAALHRAGDLTDAEFAAAKERLLGGTGDVRPGVSKNLETNWIRTRQQYMFHEGGIPTRGALFAVWIMGGVFVFLMLMMISASGSSIKPEHRITAFVTLAFIVMMLAILQMRANRFFRAERRTRDLRLGQGTTNDGWTKVDDRNAGPSNDNP